MLGIKQFRGSVVLVVLSALLTGCVVDGGHATQIPAALSQIKGVASVEVGDGYDGLTSKRVVKVYLASDPVGAEEIRQVFVALGDIDFSDVGTINLSFLNAHTGARSDVTSGVRELMRSQGEPIGDYLPDAFTYFGRSAGLSISHPERVKEIADYVRQ